MPKVKTKSGAKKRFKVTGILTKKGTKQKRNLTHSGLVHESDMKNIKAMLNL